MCKNGIKRKKSKNKKLDRSIFIGQNVFIHRAKLDRMKSKKTLFLPNEFIKWKIWENLCSYDCSYEDFFLLNNAM